jgi:glycosyltransferase involved in cell wall biosynthesis
MRMSILILTHNRPKLFQRCLESALNNIPIDVEILVNNDSNDIEEIQHPQVQYFYENPEHLSDKYKFLLDKAKGEHIYYLEDDDYLVTNFYNIVMPLLDHDFIAGNYFPTWNNGWVLRCVTSQTIEINLVGDELQLSQFIMRRSIACTFEFPKDSHIHNDQKMVTHVYKNAKSAININKVLYYQTTDGGDNISFPESKNYYGI